MNFLEKLTEEHKKELSNFIDENRKKLEARKVQAILLIEEGMSAELIKTLTGIKRETAVKARKLYMKHGIKVLESKKKEKQPRRLLTKNQREEFGALLRSKTPRAFGYHFDTWTTSIIGELILQLYGVLYKSKTSLYVIFKEAKITYHKPEKVYEKRNQKVIDEWKAMHQDTIAAALKDPETVVLVEDEMIITTQSTLQRVWLPKGTQVVVPTSNTTRKRRSLYGFSNVKTGQEIAFKSEQQTSLISVKFLKEVVRQFPNKKIVLFWDNAPWHKGEAMRAFLSTCTNLHIINFPPYSPDENPQEHIWKAVRANITHNKFIPDIDKITKDILLYLNNSIFKYSFFGFTAP
jgi:transposase